MKKRNLLVILAVTGMLAACGGTTSISSSGSSAGGSVSSATSENNSNVTSSNGSTSSSTSSGNTTSTPVSTNKINVTSPNGVTLTPDKTEAAPGETVTITVAVESDAFTVTEVLYDDKPCTKVNDTTYTFVMPKNPVYVTAKVTVSGDVTLQGELSAVFTKNSQGIYVVENVSVPVGGASFDIVIKGENGASTKLTSKELNRYKTLAGLEPSRSSDCTFDIAGGATYNFYYDATEGNNYFYVQRTKVNQLPSTVDGLHDLFYGEILSEDTMNHQGVTAVHYTNRAANETYDWKLYDNNTSYAKVTEKNENSQDVTVAEVYTKLEDDLLTVVDTYTPSTKDAYKYDYTLGGDTQKFAGRYVIADTDLETGNATNNHAFDNQRNYVNSDTADFVLNSFNHAFVSVETDFMHAYRVGMSVEDSVKAANVSVTSTDTTEGFTTKIVSSKTYDDSSNDGDKYHAEYRATLNFLDDGSLVSLDYEYKYFDQSDFNFATGNWISGDTAFNYENNGTVQNKVTVEYTYGNKNSVDYTFDTTPYFVSEITSLTIDNPAATLDEENSLNIGDTLQIDGGLVNFSYAPQTALDVWQYDIIDSSNESVVAFDESYNRYEVVGSGSSEMTLGSVNGTGVNKKVTVHADYTNTIRNVFLYEGWSGVYAPIIDTNSADLTAGTKPTYGLISTSVDGNKWVPLPPDISYTVLEGEDLGVKVSFNKGENEMTLDTTNVDIETSQDFVIQLTSDYFDPEWIDEDDCIFEFHIQPGVSVNDLVDTWQSVQYSVDSVTLTADASNNETYPYLGTVNSGSYQENYSFMWGFDQYGDLIAKIIQEGAYANYSFSFYLDYDVDNDQLGVCLVYAVMGEDSLEATDTNVFGGLDEGFPQYEICARV